jgi:hypothetical protein
MVPFGLLGQLDPCGCQFAGKLLMFGFLKPLRQVAACFRVYSKPIANAHHFRPQPSIVQRAQRVHQRVQRVDGARVPPFGQTEPPPETFGYCWLAIVS